MTETSNRLAPPSGELQPLKANVFEYARVANAQLAPIFPYLHPGAHVPACVFFRGRPGQQIGRFFHRNSVEEIIITFGSRNCFAPPGMMVMDGKMHEVQVPIDREDPESFLVAVITQRQLEEGEQNESVVFRCSECNAKVYQHEYPATPSAVAQSERARAGEFLEMFATMRGSIAATDEYNRDEEIRTCPKCGHVNDRFPVEQWGWAEWVLRHDANNAGERSLEAAAHERAGI